jgi:hypothetical protein
VIYAVDFVLMYVLQIQTWRPSQWELLGVAARPSPTWTPWHGGVYPQEMQEVLSRGSWPQYVLRVHCWTGTVMQMHVLWRIMRALSLCRSWIVREPVNNDVTMQQFNGASVICDYERDKHHGFRSFCLQVELWYRFCSTVSWPFCFHFSFVLRWWLFSFLSCVFRILLVCLLLLGIDKLYFLGAKDHNI